MTDFYRICSLRMLLPGWPQCEHIDNIRRETYLFLEDILRHCSEEGGKNTSRSKQWDIWGIVYFCYCYILDNFLCNAFLNNRRFSRRPVRFTWTCLSTCINAVVTALRYEMEFKWLNNYNWDSGKVTFWENIFLPRWHNYLNRLLNFISTLLHL